MTSRTTRFAFLTAMLAALVLASFAMWGRSWDSAERTRGTIRHISPTVEQTISQSKVSNTLTLTPGGSIRRFSSVANTAVPASARNHHSRTDDRGKNWVDDSLPKVLILTPIKNSLEYMSRYFELLGKLSYPKHLLSLALLNSGSDDRVPSYHVTTLQEMGYEKKEIAAMTGSGAALFVHVPELLKTGWASITIVEHTFNFTLPEVERHKRHIQLQRRAVIARSRNYLLVSALGPQEWVLWVDSDLREYPANIVQTLLSAGKDIVVPNCVRKKGSRSYDLNSWRGVNAPGNNASVTTVRAWHDMQGKEAKQNDERWLEGYGETRNIYLDTLKYDGDVVRLDAVGGAMLLVRAELHRHGLVFPPVVYRHRIETEGLAMMGMDMGTLSWGMPHVEIVHS